MIGARLVTMGTYIGHAVEAGARVFIWMRPRGGIEHNIRKGMDSLCCSVPFSIHQPYIGYIYFEQWCYHYYNFLVCVGNRTGY